MDRAEQIEQMFQALAGANMEQLLETYRKVEVRRKEHKAVMDELDAISDRLETMMNDLLLARGEDGAVTAHGSVTRKISEQYYAEDKTVFRDWAMQNNLPELVNISLATRAFSAYMTQIQVDKQANGVESPIALPPGVGIKQTIKLSITK
jgi:hypothetical protein